jgi:hypothetical protein
MQNEYDSEQITPIMRVCKKCNECKPLALFKYKLTRAQMKAQGYAGNHLVTAEGKVCKDCRPKRKPLSRLTTKELVTKASSGDIHPFVAKLRIQKIKDDATALKARGSAERWQKLWAGYMKEIIKPLTEDIVRTQHAIKYSERIGRYARAEFYATYLGHLEKLKSRLTHDQRVNPCEPKLCRWEEYFDESTAAQLREDFAALPMQDKKNLRTLPTMVKYRYIGAPDNKFKRPHRATPAERLGNGHP